MSRIEKQVARSQGKPTAREAWNEAMQAKANVERLTKILGAIVEREGGMLVLDVEEVNRISAREIQFNRAPDGKSMLVSSPAFLLALGAVSGAARRMVPTTPRKGGPMTGDAAYCLASAANHADAMDSPKTAAKFRALRHAIEIVVETIDEEGTQGDLDERAERLQVNARAIWCRGDSRDEGYVIARQRRSAKEYESAREAFAYAYRFETACEVLR